VNQKEEIMDERVLTNLNNAQQVQENYKTLMKDHLLKRQLSNLLRSVFDYDVVEFRDEAGLLQEMKDGLAQLMSLTNREKKELEVDFYGLTGAGLQFRDKVVKVMCRHPNYVSLLKERVIPIVSQRLRPGDPINSIWRSERLNEQEE